jgi:hypothetical protein
MHFNRWRAGKQILSLLRATRNVVFETQFDNLQEFVNSLFPVRLHRRRRRRRRQFTPHSPA